MEIRDNLLERIGVYRKAKGLSETAFGRAAVQDGAFIRRLRDGKGVTLTTIERATEYMTNNPIAAVPASADSQDKGQAA